MGPKAMKKFINSFDDLVRDSAAGLVMAHEELLVLNETPLFVCRRTPKQGRVALVSGGGSGHEPLHTGYVGPGMLDAACPGQVFTAPTPDQIVAAAQRVEAGQGVLMVVKNYGGDCASFQVASDMLEVECATVLVNDDVAAAPTFDIGPSEMEVGVGIHGEPGRLRRKLAPADDVVAMLLEPILKDLALAAGRSVLLHVNGFGGTPLIELNLLNGIATRRLRDAGLHVKRWLVGNHTTSLEMAGASITLTALDDELTSLWDAPVTTPSLRW